MLNELFYSMTAHHLTAFIDEIKFLRSSLAAGPVRDAIEAGLPVREVGATALIPIRGTVLKNGIEFWGYKLSHGTREIQAAVEAAVADEGIERIVLLVDSPGGSVDGTVELADAVYAARQVKPVIAQVDGMAASAAYWIASQATTIIAGRSSLVGSIGVFTILYDDSKWFEDNGIRAIPVTTGDYKVVGAPGVEITDDQAADMKRTVDDYFQDFLGAIKRGRPQLSDEEILEAADGRIFKADSEAIKMGLIDALGWPSDLLKSESSRQSRRRVARAAAAKIIAFNLKAKR